MVNYNFTYNQEIGHQGQSLKPHFPGGKSGVTIGPGYDMGGRSPQEIYSDLIKAGIDPETAKSFQDAAYKTGEEAQEWVAHHGNNLNITDEEQQALFNNVLVPDYEKRAQMQLISFAEHHPEISTDMIEWENLTDRQKQMLFDFAYNPGLEQFPSLTASILKEDWFSAAHHFERYSGGEPLFYRNEMFYQEFIEKIFPENDQSNEHPINLPDFLDSQESVNTHNTPNSDETTHDDWYETPNHDQNSDFNVPEDPFF